MLAVARRLVDMAHTIYYIERFNAVAEICLVKVVHLYVLMQS